jgi:Fur family peroxide stress response transcriptional regulator
MRYSKQRENIKKGLEKFCIHPTAEELYFELKPHNPNLSLATVYRNLNQLAKLGEIKKIEGLSGQVHYDHNNDEHFHMICLKCNKIIDLPPQIAESLKLTLKKQSEFEILSYDILVKGLCSGCKADEIKKG